MYWATLCRGGLCTFTAGGSSSDSLLEAVEESLDHEAGGVKWLCHLST